MKNYYHGTKASGILELKAISGNHEEHAPVVFFTTNRAYSLFYIIDKEINWVTCGVDENGIVQYKEQFSNQLSAIYDNVSGYIYTCVDSPFIVKTKTKGIYSSVVSVPVAYREYIDNVYTEILKCESLGFIQVKRYEALTDEEKQEILAMMLHYIFKNDLLSLSTKKAAFIKDHFIDAWKQAEANPEMKQYVLDEWDKKHH